LLNIAKEGEIPLMDENIREYLRDEPRYKTTNRSLYFRTQSIEELKPMADLFLDTEGKKIIPPLYPVQDRTEYCRSFNS
jgi:hypothetical protein